ncbi:MAG: CHASE2 domain-containing protein, partial [Candidatus Neomarinimicrobiota bacterium]|nr:CHASE2 domain-containing protein [Candidatus Neomarinimicrobiota bacterium]
MNSLKRYLNEKWIGLSITLSSILIISILHLFGIFDVLELKTYDYRFSNVRGPLTGWASNDSTYIKMGTDIVLVEVDDEAYRLMPEQWPYPRGTVWGRVIKNLTQAGAKVIAFDIQFDAPETKSEYLHDFADKINSEELKQLIPRHGDKILAEAITEAKAYGTEVVIAAKVASEASRQPPQYIANPHDEIMKAEPETGIINDQMDADGFSRRYALFSELAHQPGRAYLTLGLKSVKSFLGISDTTMPRFDPDNHIWNYGGLQIHAHGNSNTFLVNYYGPASGYKLPLEEDYPAMGTFPRYSLAYIIDTEDINLSDPMEDIDWMSQFIPGELPEWIQAIEDPVERQEMIDMMGLGGDFDITKTPFYNKIVVIGVNVEVLHDFKKTPYYNYFGIQQLTPGMETHANAIQTIIHANYLNVFGSRLTNLLYDFQWSHFLLILLLSLIAFFILDMVNPILAGVLILLEIIVYYGVVCGLFVNDLSWFLKDILASVFPIDFVR